MQAASKFNMAAVKTRGLTLLIEHSPCCILSFAAGFVGLAAFNHNPVLELGFAIGGAIVGEHIGHRYLMKNHTHASGWKPLARRYGLSIAFGLASWGIHQQLFHDRHVVAPPPAHVCGQAAPDNISCAPRHLH